MKVLKRSEINTEKWDACVRNSTKPLLYGLSWYLDATTLSKWDGLIWGDYQAVFPIPWNTKTITKQVYTPKQLKLLNIYQPKTSNVNQEEIVDHLNQYIQFSVFSDEQLLNTAKERTIQSLDINVDKEILFQNYKQDRRKDIRRNRDKVKIQPISTDTYLSHYMDMNQEAILTKRVDVNHINNIYHVAKNRQADLCYQAVFEEKVVAVIGCIGFLHRIYLLTSGITMPGYGCRANVLLIHHVIQENSGYKTFDFVGSSLPGVRSFNLSFGAKDEVYYHNEKKNLIVSGLKKILKQ